MTQLYRWNISEQFGLTRNLKFYELRTV